MPGGSFPWDLGKFEDTAVPVRMSVIHCVGFRVHFRHLFCSIGKSLVSVSSLLISVTCGASVSCGSGAEIFVEADGDFLGILG